MTLNIDEFNAALDDMSRPSLFNIHLNFPAIININLRKTSFLCKAGSLPASTITEIPISGKGGRQVKRYGERVFEPWGVTILNNTDFEVRNAFESWSNLMNGHQSNLGVDKPSDYKINLRVEQLGKNDKILKVYEMVGCFPTTISSMDLSYEATGQTGEFGVEFALDYWTSHTTT